MLLKFLPGLFGSSPMFFAKPDISEMPLSVKIECANVRWYTFSDHSTVVKVEEEIVSIEIFHLENDFKYKS